MDREGIRNGVANHRCPSLLTHYYISFPFFFSSSSITLSLIVLLYSFQVSSQFLPWVPSVRVHFPSLHTSLIFSISSVPLSPAYSLFLFSFFLIFSSIYKHSSSKYKMHLCVSLCWDEEYSKWEGSSRCRETEGFEPSLLHSPRCFTSFHVSCRFSYSRILHPLVQSLYPLHLLLHLLDSPVLSIRQSPFRVSCCGHKWLVLSPSPIIYLPSLRPFSPSLGHSSTYPPLFQVLPSFLLTLKSVLLVSSSSLLLTPHVEGGILSLTPLHSLQPPTLPSLSVPLFTPQCHSMSSPFVVPFIHTNRLPFLSHISCVFLFRKDEEKDKKD